MKFTPGPWSINEWTQKDDRISIGAVGTPLIAYVPSRDVSYNEQKCNANLIAAAPDLLEAVEDLYWNAEDRGETTDEDGQEYDDWKAVRLAIKKAKGE
jgi:hypothetical protein